MTKTVVVLGAGVGGLTTAAELRKVLPTEDRIVLVDRSFTGSLGLSSLWVLRGWCRPDEVLVTPTAAALPGVSLVTGAIEHVDTDTKTVHCRGARPIGYDALVVALGAGLDTSAVPGLDAALASGVAGQFFTPGQATDLHHRLDAIQSGRVLVLVTGEPLECPLAPFEAALLIADQLGERFASGAVRVDTITSDQLPMPVAEPMVGKTLVGLLEEKNIEFQGGKSTTSVNAHSRKVEFSDGTNESFDLLAVVPPHCKPAAQLIPTVSGPTGSIPVEPSTLATTKSGVWAIGDAAVVPMPNGKPLPKAAVFAETQARVVAHQVAHYLGYEALDTPFTGDGTRYLEIGGGMAVKGLVDFLHDPTPEVTLLDPSPAFHVQKQRQELDWLARWNGRRPVVGQLQPTDSARRYSDCSTNLLRHIRIASGFLRMDYKATAGQASEVAAELACGSPNVVVTVDNDVNDDLRPLPCGALWP